MTAEVRDLTERREIWFHPSRQSSGEWWVVAWGEQSMRWLLENSLGEYSGSFGVSVHVYIRSDEGRDALLAKAVEDGLDPEGVPSSELPDQRGRWLGSKFYYEDAELRQ